jgi:hypothetical protein
LLIGIISKYKKMSNTISTKTYRDKYRSASLDTLLRAALVAEKVCEVDRSNSKTIQNPYGSQPTATVQALAGTYTPATFITTDDTLTVADEVVIGEHVYNFEALLSRFDLFANRQDEINYSIATAIDKWVINCLCEDANGTYSTPSGGFTTAANINVIMSNLASKVAGYADAYKGLFLIIENTDVPGFVQAQATNGYSFADAALKNGFMSSYMGIDIYVVRSGTFADETTSTASGTKTWTNSGHRVFGVKNVTTYAAPRNITWDEKGVTGKTGKEICMDASIGFKAWVTKYDLIIDITLVA